MNKKKLSPKELKNHLAAVKLLTLDVDGVLTDGSLYYAEDGTQLRKFSVKDGLGIKLAMAAGVQVALITASTTPAIRIRGEQLGVGHVFLGAEDKLETVKSLCGEMGIGLDAVAHIGDDLNDLPVLKAVGCPMTVADAVAEVLDAVLFVSGRGGGDGAVREICEILAAAKAG